VSKISDDDDDDDDDDICSAHIEQNNIMLRSLVSCE